MQSFIFNPNFFNLYPEVRKIAFRFEEIKDIIQNQRNDIRLLELNGKKIVIKSFKGMYFFNRLAYSTVRRSKASRSYRYSFLLKSKGVNVPEPVAFINNYSLGVLSSSLYICEFVEHQRLSQIINNPDLQPALLKDLSNFVFFLHLSSVYHDDLSPGNILCEKRDGVFHFTLIDLNRVRFKQVSYKDGINNLTKLSANHAILRQIATEYALLWGEDKEAAKELVIRSLLKRNWLLSKRKALKRKILWFITLLKPTRNNDIPENHK